MKRIISFVLAACAALLLALSCSMTNPVASMRIHVQDVEANYKHYTQEQWDDANAAYERICNEFKQQKMTLSKEERNEFRELQGRYAAVVAKGAIEGVTESVEEIAVDTQEVESFLKGLFKSDDDKEK